MMFIICVENHLLGNTKLSSLVSWFKSYRPCQAKGLIFLFIFGFFVDNHLLENTKLSFLVSCFELLTLQAKGLIFLIIFGFFVN